MRSVGLFEAKQKLSELVQRASKGERIGITRRGKLVAVIIPPFSPSDLKDVFERIEQIRKRVKHRHGLKIEGLIEEGRT
jgi:prevent-host-death family protein